MDKKIINVLPKIIKEHGFEEYDFKINLTYKDNTPSLEIVYTKEKGLFKTNYVDRLLKKEFNAFCLQFNCESENYLSTFVYITKFNSARMDMNEIIKLKSIINISIGKYDNLKEQNDFQ
ncbi:hypothetical protein GWW53_08415 [Campylobacter jejuni]|nr:hypothetical protein [Campylobacter jejuni]